MEFTEEQKQYLEQQIADAKTKWESEILNPVVTERDNLLQFKPIEKSDAEKALEQRELELFKKEIGIELKANQIDDFAEFIQVSNMDELKTKIEALNTVLEARKINGAYKPDDHKQQTAYDVVRSKGDTQGMIKALFGLK